MLNRLQQYGVRARSDKCMFLQDSVNYLGHRNGLHASRMKSLARCHVWWPCLDEEVEEVSKSCRSCQEVKSLPPTAPLHPWIWPDRPWQRVHVDFAGPFKGSMFLLLVDSHSKWPEIYPMSSTTVFKTIEVLRHIFSSYGIPEQLVSDNGSQFTSEEFTDFVKRNDIKHIRTACAITCVIIDLHGTS